MNHVSLGKGIGFILGRDNELETGGRRFHSNIPVKKQRSE